MVSLKPIAQTSVSFRKLALDGMCYVDARVAVVQALREYPNSSILFKKAVQIENTLPFKAKWIEFALRQKELDDPMVIVKEAQELFRPKYLECILNYAVTQFPANLLVRF